jgi:hypothetical protein
MVPDEKQYGKLLYLESDSHEQNIKKGFRNLIILCFGGGILIIIMMIPFLFFAISGSERALEYLGLSMAFTISTILAFFVGRLLYQISKEWVKIAIFEKGIRFSNPNIPLTFFHEIGHIKLGIDNRSGANYFALISKNDKRQIVEFADGKMKWAHKFPEDYNKIYKIIVKQLKKLNPDIDESRLIIDTRK